MSIETPMKRNNLTNFKKRQKIESYFRKIMQTLELDLSDDSLKGTPKRVAKMYVDEIFSGLDDSTFPTMTAIENKMKLSDPVIVANIQLNSNCEHHFIPIIGVCHIAYIPNKTILGLSKFARLVEFYSKRPQVQERLALQIQSKLQEILGTQDVAVVIDAVHTCMRTRGVKDGSSLTRSIHLAGEFKSGHKDHFLSSIPKSVEFKL